MSFDENIKKLNIILPEAKPPVGNYVATKIAGNLLYISGQVSINSNGELIKGKVGKDLTTDVLAEGTVYKVVKSAVVKSTFLFIKLFAINLKRS